MFDFIRQAFHLEGDVLLVPFLVEVDEVGPQLGLGDVFAVLALNILNDCFVKIYP
jgi:hypothetical protein